MKSKLRILIAEDNHQMREFMIGLLKTEFEVVGAVPTGRELVSRALELLPDVIVSDTSMPMMGGVTAMNELRSAGLIFLSSSLVLYFAARVYLGIQEHSCTWTNLTSERI